ncbi:hypothetical protein tb265_25420 [Gemmatimonadetes bacterium T265]|nr:hypothetical protein tb265_25420 [Gemmatimonadetes bacterium T265]
MYTEGDAPDSRSTPRPVRPSSPSSRDLQVGNPVERDQPEPTVTLAKDERISSPFDERYGEAGLDATREVPPSEAKDRPGRERRGAGLRRALCADSGRRNRGRKRNADYHSRDERARPRGAHTRKCHAYPAVRQSANPGRPGR